MWKPREDDRMVSSLFPPLENGWETPCLLDALPKKSVAFVLEGCSWNLVLSPVSGQLLHCIPGLGKAVSTRGTLERELASTPVRTTAPQVGWFLWTARDKGSEGFPETSVALFRMSEQ